MYFVYKHISDYTVKRRKVKRIKKVFAGLDIKITKLYKEGGEQIMKDFRKIFKKGGFSIAVIGDYTKDQPQSCSRWGRVDIPSVTGYFYVLIVISYHRWFIHWEVEKCVYWEL